MYCFFCSCVEGLGLGKERQGISEPISIGAFSKGEGIGFGDPSKLPRTLINTKQVAGVKGNGNLQGSSGSAGTEQPKDLFSFLNNVLSKDGESAEKGGKKRKAEEAFHRREEEQLKDDLLRKNETLDALKQKLQGLEHALSKGRQQKSKQLIQQLEERIGKTKEAIDRVGGDKQRLSKAISYKKEGRKLEKKNLF